MRHTYSPGSVDYHGTGGVENKVVFEWELINGNFSMSAEVWNRSHTDILAGGQMVDEAAAMFPNNSKVQRMAAVWQRWHLNDMRPGCEHQREWDTSKPIIMVRYMLNTDVWQQQNSIKHMLTIHLAATGTASATPEEQRILGYKMSFNQGADIPLTDDLKSIYHEDKREHKTAGWVYPTEHPEGLLTKPCPVCGYKYGSKWLREELPADVVAEIASW